MRVFDATRPKARKAHRCDDCSRTIEAGERYWRQAAIDDDGGLQAFVLCAHCTVLADWICRIDPYAVDHDGLDVVQWMRETGPDFPQLNSEFAGQWAGVDLEELRARLRPVPDAAAAMRP